MDIDHFLFDIGDWVAGRGQFRQVGGEMWFCPPHGVARAGPRRFRMSEYAVRMNDMELSMGVGGSGVDPAVGRWGTVTGVWLGNAIRVEEWSPDRPPQAPEPPKSTQSRPPCPPPVGGWPMRRAEEGAFHDNLEFDLGDLEETGAAITVGQFRPGPHQTVLVVAAADEAAVEGYLRPQLGARLCVIPSRWTKAQVDQVRAVLWRHFSEWTLSSFGNGSDEQGQRVVFVRLFRVLPEMARWAVDVPDGLLEVDPVLAPAAR